VRGSRGARAPRPQPLRPVHAACRRAPHRTRAPRTTRLSAQHRATRRSQAGRATVVIRAAKPQAARRDGLHRDIASRCRPRARATAVAPSHSELPTTCATESAATSPAPQSRSLVVSVCRLYGVVRGAAASERTTCVRASVPSLAPEIRQVTDEEPSCGCRRVTARLRRMAHRPQALIAHLACGQLAATSPTTGGAVHILLCAPDPDLPTARCA